MPGFKDLKTETKLLLLAAACGLAAAALAFVLITGKEKSIIISMEPVKVAAAVKYIPAWTKIDESMITFIEMPKKFVTGAHILKFAGYKGQMTVAPFIEGEPVLANKLAGRGDELNSAIPTGLRAVSVAVDEESGVGYMIKPGDYVDVILIYQDAPAGGRKNMAAATVMQDVRVVAVGQDFSLTKKNSSYSSVTLALTPEEAEILVFAREKGKLSFTLRALGDRVKEKIGITEFEQLIKAIKKNEAGAGAPAAPPQPAATENGGDGAIKKRGE